MSTSPNDDPVRVVADLYRLFGEGRLEETFELIHPEVTLVEPGDPAVVPWAGQVHGHEGVRRFYEGLGGALSEIEIDPESLTLEPMPADRVLATGAERGTVARTGRSYETRSAWIWTVVDGRISGLIAYHDTAAMVEALCP
jgi:ketosteroid isomerase-like protein